MNSKQDHKIVHISNTLRKVGNIVYFSHSLNIRRGINKYDLYSNDVKTVHATHTSAYDIYKLNNTYDEMLKYA